MAVKPHHFLLLLLILAFSAAVNLSPSAAHGGGAEKVKLTLYYETLCPYCSNFIVNYLYKIFENGLDEIVELKLSPYGNAKILANGTIRCQHGPWECLLNSVEACAIHVWPDLKEHFPFIYCVENLIYEHKYEEWETCFEKLNLDPKPVTDCYASGYDYKLELGYAAEINSLEPPHTYVPWVTVDGQPLYDDYRDFISIICKAYKGTDLPEACSTVSIEQVQNCKERANSINPVCYRDESTISTLSKITSMIMSWANKVGMEPM